MMRGRICLVTGGTRGIGLEIARGLEHMGAHVLIVGRDAASGQRALARVGGAELLLADLSSQRAIRLLAEEIHRRHDRLHVLINNAGALYSRRGLSEDGLERTLALNHLGYFLLTLLLIDLLRAGAPSRIINVASQAHVRGRVCFDDLQSERHYGGLSVYRASKLENLWFTYELARRLDGSGITVNAMHPGTVATGLGMESPSWFRWVKRMLIPFFRTPAAGAATAIYLAASPEVEGVTGGYFIDRRLRRSSARSLDRAAQKQLWAVSEQLTRLNHTRTPQPPTPQPPTIEK
jgi:NAD(P)-dependent dehydrogenase (short-subunit alcohol dehydrogenase family)